MAKVWNCNSDVNARAGYWASGVLSEPARVSSMKTTRTRWAVRDKRRLLAAIVEKLAGNAHISFEGNLRNLTLGDIPGAAQDETSILKRSTTWPRQDFVVLPLESGTSDRILSAIGAAVPRSVLHIQVEKAGILEFAAYDQFDPECVFLGGGIEGEFLDSLVSVGLLEKAK
jgi:hypothetical protein